MGNASPVLRAEAPVFAFVRAIVKIRSAIVLGIEEDEVNAQGGGLLLQLAGNLQQYAYAAGPVVRPVNGGAVVFLLILVRLSQWAQSRMRLTASGR